LAVKRLELYCLHRIAFDEKLSPTWPKSCWAFCRFGYVHTHTSVYVLYVWHFQCSVMQCKCCFSQLVIICLQLCKVCQWDNLALQNFMMTMQHFVINLRKKWEKIWFRLYPYQLTSVCFVVNLYRVFSSSFHQKVSRLLTLMFHNYN
jgi:hypothetical protein